jgi:glycosyltransferase involved in cell wall biosynthesis
MRDIAIYAPNASGLYSRHLGARGGGGGAELQTVLLARELTARGLDVAHIVYPVEDPLPPGPESPALVVRPRPGRGGLVREAAAIWRSLSKADARVVVVRGSGGYVAAIASWCKRRGRKLVLATSNELDFDLHRADRRRLILRAYARAARRSRRLVVQTERQVELARRTFPELDPVLIPSFAELAEPAVADGEYFLWTDRMTGYKRPEKYLELAELVPEARFRMVASESSETSPELRDPVYARARELANLELLPRRSRSTLLEEVRGAVAIVKTSEVEGMPNVFLEAWARGVPVVSLGVDPGGRIARHGAGLLAHGSMDRLAAHVRRLWEAPALRAELGARGRELVLAEHSLDAVADRWEELLRGLLDEAR